ncbi:MAG: Phosphatidate cytidylyltransferase, partial [uncultured Acetobacteraceae bacterium]
DPVALVAARHPRRGAVPVLAHRLAAAAARAALGERRGGGALPVRRAGRCGAARPLPPTRGRRGAGAERDLSHVLRGRRLGADQRHQPPHHGLRAPRLRGGHRLRQDRSGAGRRAGAGPAGGAHLAARLDRHRGRRGRRAVAVAGRAQPHRAGAATRHGAAGGLVRPRGRHGLRVFGRAHQGGEHRAPRRRSGAALAGGAGRHQRDANGDAGRMAARAGAGPAPRRLRHVAQLGAGGGALGMRVGVLVHRLRPRAGGPGARGGPSGDPVHPALQPLLPRRAAESERDRRGAGAGVRRGARAGGAL